MSLRASSFSRLNVFSASFMATVWHQLQHQSQQVWLRNCPFPPGSWPVGLWRPSVPSPSFHCRLPVAIWLLWSPRNASPSPPTHSRTFPAFLLLLLFLLFKLLVLRLDRGFCRG